MGPEAITRIAESFVTVSPGERLEAHMAPCPPRVSKAWHIRMAWRTAAEARKHSVARVASLISQTHYVFLEQPPRRQEISWAAMSEAEQAEANEAWRQAQIVAAPSDEGEQDDEARIDKAMVDFMRQQMKWAHKDLHDALLAAGVAGPPIPSMCNYLASLRAQYGNPDTGFLPQSFLSYTKTKCRTSSGYLLGEVRSLEAG